MTARVDFGSNLVRLSCRRFRIVRRCQRTAMCSAQSVPIICCQCGLDGEPAAGRQAG